MSRIPLRAYFGDKQLYKDAVKSSDYWVRPDDWLSLPDAPSSQGVSLLCAVFDTPNNFLAFKCQGAWTIDWGDGVTQNIASNVGGYHNYSWDDIDPSTTTSRGYRQVIITITPTSGNLTYFECLKHNQTSLTNNAAVGLLDAHVNLPYLTSSSVFRFGNANNYICKFLERIRIQSWGNLGSLSYAFAGCNGLQSLNETEWNTSNITNMSYAFYTASNIRSLDTTNWNLSGVTTFANAFQSCASLRNINGIENWNVSSATNFSNAFNACSNLFVDVYEIDLNNWNTSLVQNMNGMFNTCGSMRSIKFDSWNTSSLTNLTSFLASCGNLESVTLSSWNVNSVTTAYNMFNACANLKTLTLPAFNDPGFNSGATVVFTNSNSSLSKINWHPNTNITKSINFTTCSLDSTQINNIYTMLGTATAGAIVTVSSNYGAATDDTTIATAKGWTVTG